MNDNFNKLDQEILVEPFISSYRVDQQATVYPIKELLGAAF